MGNEQATVVGAPVRAYQPRPGDIIIYRGVRHGGEIIGDQLETDQFATYWTNSLE